MDTQTLLFRKVLSAVENMKEPFPCWQCPVLSCMSHSMTDRILWELHGAIFLRVILEKNTHEMVYMQYSSALEKHESDAMVPGTTLWQNTEKHLH